MPILSSFGGGSVRGFGFNIASADSNNIVEFRVWGAGGGGGSNYSNRWAYQSLRADGGDGGYAKGQVAAPQNTTFYIQVGKGGSNIQGGSTILFGGGARPGNGSFYGGQGGGASGVFTINSELKNLSSTTGPIIVAGGGGGGGNGSHGGHGGGNEGEDANTSGDQYAGRTGGLRGTQTAGGGSISGDSAFTALGLGSWSNQNLAGGGGGGWYGGSGGTNSTGGGGGSGYVGFNGNATLSALTNTVNTVAAGSSGGVGNTSTRYNTAGNATAGTAGKVEVWVNGSLSNTFNYTGGMQSVTI